MLFTVLLFSGFYLVEEWDHECEGEDCPICECIAQCQSFFREFFGGEMAQEVCMFTILCCLGGILSVEPEIIGYTLISWKVRLNP